MEIARTLVETMSGKWDPSEFKDEYRDKLIELIEEKVARGGKEVPGPKVKAKAPTNVVDLVSVLQKSLAESKKKSGGTAARSNSRGRKKMKKAAYVAAAVDKFRGNAFPKPSSGKTR